MGWAKSCIEYSRSTDSRTKQWKTGAKKEMQEAGKLTNDEN